MTYSYQQIKKGDVTALKSLLKVFGEAFESSDYAHPPSDKYLDTLLEKKHFIAIVARREDKVVGGLTAYVLDKFEQERKEIYIYDLAVEVEHRRRGIASGLIRSLKTIAKRQGAYVIYVQADKEDTSAIKLYGSLGKPKDVFHFDIPVA